MLSALIVAGGSSQRMGFDKLFAVFAGAFVLAHSMRAFDRATSVNDIIVVAQEERHDVIRKLTADAGVEKVRTIARVADRRLDAVRAGLAGIRRRASF